MGNADLRRYGGWGLLGVSIILAFLAGNFLGDKLINGGERTFFRDIYDGETERPISSGPLPPAPGMNASDQEKADYGRILHERAEKTSLMKITAGCALNPAVASVKESSIFYFENEDSQAHKIRIEKIDISLAPGEKKNITIKFENGLGYYGIQCDNNFAVGFFEVEPAAENP